MVAYTSAVLWVGSACYGGADLRRNRIDGIGGECFTEEEFEVAWGQYKASGKPRIFTYFKSAEITLGGENRDDLMSLWEFQKKLKGLGHYQSNYKSAGDLKLQFRDQLSRVIELGEGKLQRRGA